MSNPLLRELLAEARWTGQALAKAVNALGTETGVRLSYDRTGVAHWLAGSRPRPPVPELIAEAFARRLGRRVTLTAIGLYPGSGEPDAKPWQHTDVAARLVRLCESGLVSRRTTAGCAYSLASLSVPAWPALAATRSVAPTARDNVVRVEHADVQAAALMIELFSDADLTFGGGRVRATLESYLRTTVVPWLRADARPAVRRELAATAARLCYLCGFLCFDDESHGTAQQYYLAALSLAGEAGKAADYAITLRALSEQARVLGHHRQARDLAEAGLRAAPSRSSARTRAFLAGQAAATEAAAGEQRQAVIQLHEAESCLERASSSPAPVGAYHAAALNHHRAITRASLGDRRAAISALTRSLRHRAPAERRARALTLAALAELHLDAGQLDHACQAWDEFATAYPELRSRRADTALARSRARLRPHSTYPAARVVRQKISRLRAPADSRR
jgi:hypothetical protein